MPPFLLMGRQPGINNTVGVLDKKALIREINIFYTPSVDPGPASNIYSSTQLEPSLAGYTGLQSSQLAGSSGGGWHGKSFLFSLWGATKGVGNTSPGPNGSGGGQCHSGADGSPGISCGYEYDWVAGHTYKFTVTADTSPGRGVGWFKSHVTDVTPGSTHDEFDIASIYQPNAIVQPTDGIYTIPLTYFLEFTEYIDWNSRRSNCAGIANAEITISLQVIDTTGNIVPLGKDDLGPNKACPPEYATSSTSDNIPTNLGGPHGAIMHGGALQSAAGLFKTNYGCLMAPQGASEGQPQGSNFVMLGACPTVSDVRTKGGGSYLSYLWVWAGDGTIQLKDTYCLTAQGVGVTVRTCAPNALNQQWTKGYVDNGLVAQNTLVSKSTGLCLAPPSNSSQYLTLQPCTPSKRILDAAGQEFHLLKRDASP